MATKGSHVRATQNGGQRPRSRPLNDESNGLVKTLWADLRGKELPHADDPIEDAWYDEHQEERRALAGRIAKVHNISADRRENWRRRYWN